MSLGLYIFCKKTNERIFSRYVADKYVFLQKFTHWTAFSYMAVQMLLNTRHI